MNKPIVITLKSRLVDNQDDRLRMVFGLARNDAIPKVSHETLLVYHEHLAATLVLPFKAEHGVELGRPERLTVIGLGESDGDTPHLNTSHGVLCDALMGTPPQVLVPLCELQVPKNHPDRHLIEDYCHWFKQYR